MVDTAEGAELASPVPSSQWDGDDSMLTPVMSTATEALWCLNEMSPTVLGIGILGPQMAVFGRLRRHGLAGGRCVTGGRLWESKDCFLLVVQDVLCSAMVDSHSFGTINPDW